MTASVGAAPAPGATISALGRFDGRKLATSGLFMVGLGMAVLGVAVFAQALFTGDQATWDDDAWTVGAGFLLWAIFTMLAVNRAALRDQREHTGEQHETLPVGTETRAVGMVVATLWPSAITVVFLGIVVAGAATRIAVPGMAIIHVVHTGALVMMLGALGVALAVWVRSTFVGPVVAFAFYLVHPGEAAASWHAIWPLASPSTPWLAGWHMVYLLALAAVFTIVAAARPGVRRRHTVAILIASATAISALTLVINGACPSIGPCQL
jgi:hypothetical protein